MNDEQIKYMVDRFLEWRLPENFNPDAGISFKPNFNEHTAYPTKHEPVGTNLFDATQAEEMVRYLIDGMTTDELRKTLVGNPTVEEWAEWIVSRHNFCEHNAGSPLEKYPWLRCGTWNRGSQLYNSQISFASWDWFVSLRESRKGREGERMKIKIVILLALFETTLFAQSANQVPKPEWVPDPSAGHYDCPNGWTAYSRSEPNLVGIGPVSAIYIAPHLDKKGHLLGDQPPMPICIKDGQP